jgi:RNA polymerase sigma-70 factor (ECF subfamily)
MGSGNNTTAVEDPVDRAVRDFQAGIEPEQSFRLLVDLFYQPVRNFFSRRVFSADECLDLTQETFLGLYKGLEGFRAEARFEFWLFRIAQTTYLKWLRGRKRRPERGLQEAGPGGETPSTGSDDHQPVAVTPETQLTDVLHQERLEKLRAAISGLPRQMQKCVVLRVYHDRSYREIADFLELSIDTVKAHLFQARKKLREMLEGDFDRIEL